MTDHPERIPMKSRLVRLVRTGRKNLTLRREKHIGEYTLRKPDGRLIVVTLEPETARGLVWIDNLTDEIVNRCGYNSRDELKRDMRSTGHSKWLDGKRGLWAHEIGLLGTWVWYRDQELG